MKTSHLTLSELERKLYIENSPIHSILVSTIDEISEDFDDLEERYNSGHRAGYDRGYVEGYDAAVFELSE